MGQSYLFTLPPEDEEERQRVYAFLDGRCYTLNGKPGVFHYEVWGDAHVLFHDADGEPPVRDRGCGWQGANGFRRLAVDLAIARDLGYSREKKGSLFTGSQR